MEIGKLTIDITANLKLQDYYDDLVTIRDSMTAQIEYLETRPHICSHKETEKKNFFVKRTQKETEITTCKICGKWLTKGDFSVVGIEV